jgi:pimeloyl-ACP methyl ester carboxylesterase
VHPGRAVLHGHEVTYLEAGDGSPVVLLHGIAGSSAAWAPVIECLGGRLHVVAPDLLGHGASAKPRGDYSLGAYASGVRDLLALLDVDRVTVVGHSLGGGVAMQFAYQFPERCERLVLVSSGGLGREVTPLLRAATLPGAEWLIPVLAHRRVQSVGAAVDRRVGRLPLARRPALREVARGFASLGETDASSAFVRTLRSVVDLTGQRVDARDRLYLATDLPTLLVWGVRDSFIPVSHGLRTAELIPGSRLELFERAGHFPHLDDPRRFARVLVDFVSSTPAARLEPQTLRERILARSAASSA